MTDSGQLDNCLKPPHFFFVILNSCFGYGVFIEMKKVIELILIYCLIIILQTVKRWNIWTTTARNGFELYALPHAFFLFL